MKSLSSHINEGFEKTNTVSWSKMMKGVKSGSKSGPWAIVAIENRKFKAQTVVKVMDAIPAHFESFKKEHKNSSIHIEDNEGTTVFVDKN